jgi:hypothetical protein
MLSSRTRWKYCPAWGTLDDELPPDCCRHLGGCTNRFIGRSHLTARLAALRPLHAMSKRRPLLLLIERGAANACPRTTYLFRYNVRCSGFCHESTTL